MGNGQNYEDKHEGVVAFFRGHFSEVNLDEFTWTSDPDKTFNCFGFAIGQHDWWQPPPFAGDDEGDPQNVWQ